uniref:uncharacterized protein LOC120342439 n=1 Tax=Styela clava TaxID=7725 RepID=UPI00193AA5E3|nr:uncharacterized protein LOC120342439 [Styela clava]
MRLYQVNVDDAEPGIYNVSVNEILGGREYALFSTSEVQVYEATSPDEYLYRIAENRVNILSTVSDFHQYWYDGPDDTYILDGGNDMYDRGNYITISSGNSVTSNVPYGKPFTTPSYLFSSKTTYPFTSLMWISNVNGVEDIFSMKVSGKTGAFGTGMTSQFSSSFTHSGYNVWYKTFQVYDASPDPSICEVYFYVTNEELWASVPPTSVNLTVASASTINLDNTFSVSGGPQNIMIGYLLLSNSYGNETLQSEVNPVMHKITSVIEEKDAFTIMAEEDEIELEMGEESATLSVTITSLGNWNGYDVTLETPLGEVYNVTNYTDNDNARVYSYSLTSLTESDSGMYIFHATDKYKYALTAETKLIIFSAEVIIATPEYWGVTNDAEVVLSVMAIANNWTDTTVMVLRPDGSVHEAIAESNTGVIRTFTHRVTNLFVEDAGVYQFTTQRNGLVSSRPGNVTLYLFSIEILPDSSSSHAITKETKATLMVYVACDGDWANVQGKVTTPSKDVIDMYSEPGAVPSVKAYLANVTDVTAGQYDIVITESLGVRTESKYSRETITVHNSTHVDEYLYRIGLVTDEIRGYIPEWKDYWYDGVDNTYISDGGFDMYDRGNYISYSWMENNLAGMETRIPYGKPFKYESFEFSSKAFYPFVTLMWIDNSNQIGSDYSITVEGRAGAAFDSVVNQYTRILFEGTYDVTYNVFHLNGTSDPSICEVYFLITNTFHWNSVAPSSFHIHAAGASTGMLENTVHMGGSPSNVMLGYTLLSKANGAEVTYLDVERVLEKYVDIIAERDQFGIRTTSDDGYYVSTSGENATVQATVTTSGKWNGINVEVTLPSGQIKPVTDYTLDPIHTKRIYEYHIIGARSSDIGDYSFAVTDKYDELETTAGYLHVFTTEILPTSESEYVGDSGDTVTMEIFVRTENTNLGMLNVEIETPNLGAVPVTDRTTDSTNIITYRYEVVNPTHEQDNGLYRFHVVENFETYTDESTWDVTLDVFSVSSSIETPSYTTNMGAETLQISGLISTLGNWEFVDVTIRTPARGTPEVAAYELTENPATRIYIYTMREVTSRDSGAYQFVATETINNEQRVTESESIEVIVKEEKLSGGEIAGIVIGSIAGAAISIGLLVYCCRRGNSKSEKSSVPLNDDVTAPVKEKSPENTEKSVEKKEKDDDVTAL